MPDETETSIHRRIAARVKALRQAKAWSIETLASRSGVSRSMISLLERAESSPTAIVLDRLAHGLGVPLASLFDEMPAEPSPLSRRADQMPWRDPASGYVRRNVSPGGVASPMRIIDVELPAGARIAYDTAHQGQHQQVWVLEGQVEFTLGPTTWMLDTGDCLAVRLEAPTAFHNATKRTARYAVVIAIDARPLPTVPQPASLTARRSR